MISKGCVPASSCKESSISIAGIGYWLNCCTNADNCNTASKVNTQLQVYLWLLMSKVIVKLFF